MPEIAGIGVLTAFLAGIVSFLSPCVLPLVPGYISFVAGRSLDQLTDRPSPGERLAVLGLSAAFVLGFSAVFIALGASASAIGQLFQLYRFEASYIAGAVIILFGLHMTGLLRFGWLDRERRFMPEVTGGRPLGAFFLGSAFAFGWTPCVGPALAAILTLSATTVSVGDGALLLSIYSLGLGVPFLLVALFTGRFMAQARRLRRMGRTFQIGSGGILVAVGTLMLTGQLFSFGTWMLNTFPVFQRIQI